MGHAQVCLVSSRSSQASKVQCNPPESGRFFTLFDRVSLLDTYPVPSYISEKPLLGQNAPLRYLATSPVVAAVVSTRLTDGNRGADTPMSRNPKPNRFIHPTSSNPHLPPSLQLSVRVTASQKAFSFSYPRPTSHILFQKSLHPPTFFSYPKTGLNGQRVPSTRLRSFSFFPSMKNHLLSG